MFFLIMCVTMAVAWLLSFVPDPKPILGIYNQPGAERKFAEDGGD